MLRRVWLRQICASLLAAFAVVACLSPTLPLPPPSRPEVSVPDATGDVHLLGVVPGRATAYVQNRRTGRIVGQTTEDDGRYELTIPAASGDRLLVDYELHLERSMSVEVLVPDEEPENSLGGAGPGETEP